MRPRRIAINLRCARRMLAWSALMAATLVLALLLQALAAVVEPGPSDPPPACLSSAGAALTDGDGVPARFPAGLCSPSVSVGEAKS
jgi:hypothetical protein